MDPAGFKKRALLILRLVLCVGLFALLLRQFEAPVLLEALGQTATHWPWWLAALGLMFLGLLAGVLRWRDILAAQGLVLPVSQVFSIFFIGQFFNGFMLGACGGDVARAYYVARRTTHRRAEAASTVLVDRAIGLWITILVGCLLIAFRPDLFRTRTATLALAVFMLALLAGSALAGIVLFRRNMIEHWPMLQRLEWNTRLGHLFRRLYEAFYLYRNRPGVLARAAFYSVLNLAFLTWSCIAFARSLHLTVPAVTFFAFFPVITVLAAVPLTPGSLGVREGFFVMLFRVAGVENELALALSLMFYAGGLVWSLFGGLIFLGFSAGSGRRMSEDLDAIQHEPSEPAP